MKKMKLLLTLAALGSISLLGGEVTNEVRVVKVVMKCDAPKCKGEMTPGNIVLTSNPPQYPHSCNVCNTSRTFWVIYPQIRYETK